ncbi:fimbrial biogenesis chaperone [Pseudomonas paralactis]|uniref:fimbrial biogenesis chaperone n=1 Tax=Pseudomonas paralactis TaxID=1615673 RepID=UPI0009E95771|nr:molecular chaperone [Pseudomonas paralactis]
MCINTMIWAFFISLISLSGVAIADIEFDGVTRFVLNAKDKQKSITVVNTGNETVLAQITLDQGNGEQNLHDLSMALSRHLLKLVAGDRQSVEIFYQGTGLPQDRESYFLLSVTDIPQIPEQANLLQVALRHRLKFLFRPLLSMRVEDAFTKLYWTQLSRSENAGLKAHNDSPYYLTLTDISLYGQQGQICGGKVAHFMVAPFSTLDVNVITCVEPVSKITGVLVTDDGSEILKTMYVTKPQSSQGAEQ